MTGADRPGEPTTVSCAELVGRTLAQLGVTSVFGVVGSGNYVVTDALVRAGATFTAARHEAGAVGMADGYFRASGRVAAASVHQGPGLTNTITALTEAGKSRVPLVLLAGATSAGATSSNFYIDQDALARTAGAISVTLHRPETVQEETVAAYQQAVARQAPVVLQLPLDVQRCRVPVPANAARVMRSTGTVVPPSEEIAQLAESLLSARRPVFIAGRGAWRSGAGPVLAQLAERAGAMLATTAVAKGLFHGHPRDLGIAGGFSTPHTAQVLQAADLIVGVGASLTRWTTRDDTILDDGTTLVQVDHDRSALGRNRHVHLGVLGDAAATARLLLATLADGERAPASQWRAAPPAPPAADHQPVAPASGPGRVHPEWLTDELDRELPAERTVVIDGGHFIGWPATRLSVPDPAGFLFSSAGFQSIGLGLGMAVGAALARPDRLTVLAAGDGGLLMSVAELETLVRLRLPVLVVVYDDGAYGAEVHHFAGHGSGLDLVRFPPADIAGLARGLGAQALTVRAPEDIRGIRRWLDAPDGPLVVDAKIAPDVVGFWAAQDFIGH